MLRCELADHRSKCPFEKVPCKYAGIGCKGELLRKDLEQHEKDDAILHLHFAIETVSKQQEEINEQQEEIKKQQSEIKKQQSEINELQDEMDKLEEEIDEQQDEMKKQ